MNIKTFLLTITDQYNFSLRRYTMSGCPASTWGHDATTGTLWFGTADTSPAGVDDEGRPVTGDAALAILKQTSMQWPLKCDKCDYLFEKDDVWQFNARARWRREDTGGIVELRDAPVGAMWRATWMEGPAGYETKLDGTEVWVCALPHNWHWIIGSRASNCDSPCSVCAVPYHSHKVTGWDKDGHHYIDSRPHKCWVAHGEPPNMHVDKNGVTCGAGGGSIQTPNWHGFMHNGCLHE